MINSLPLEEFKAKKLPSVSKIITTVFGDAEFKSIPEHVLLMASERGTAVHHAIENYVNGGNLNIELEYQIYIDYFNDWLEDVKPTFIGLTEIRQASTNRGFKGIADAVVEVDGKMILCDWKTSSKLDMFKASLQINLYAELLEDTCGVVFDELRILSLTKRGYKWIPVLRDKALTDGLLRLYEFKRGLTDESADKRSASKKGEGLLASF